MRFQLTMALAVSLMLPAGDSQSATDVDTAARDTGHATAEATEDVTYDTAEAAKKTTHATGHAVSKTGHSIEKGASKTADQGEISKLLHAIHRFGAQVGRQLNPRRLTVAVRQFETPAYLRQGRIVYSQTPGEVGFYEYHSWAVDPGAAITTAIVEALRSGRLFLTVAPYDGQTGRTSS